MRWSLKCAQIRSPTSCIYFDLGESSAGRTPAQQRGARSSERYGINRDTYASSSKNITVGQSWNGFAVGSSHRAGLLCILALATQWSGLSRGFYGDRRHLPPCCGDCGAEAGGSRCRSTRTYASRSHTKSSIPVEARKHTRCPARVEESRALIRRE